MKISHWFLLLLIAFGAVILMILLSEPLTDATGKTHEQFSSMAHSGTSVVASEKVKWLAYFLGTGMIAVFGFTITFGAKRNEELKGIKPWLIIGIIAYLLVFAMLTFAYWQYAEKGTRGFFGGLPVPTALMLYGLGTIPLILTSIYVIKFKSWILPEEAEKRFREIVANRKQEKSSINTK